MKYDYYILGFINSMGFMITMLVATPHLGKRKGGGGLDCGYVHPYEAFAIFVVHSNLY